MRLLIASCGLLVEVAVELIYHGLAFRRARIHAHSKILNTVRRGRAKLKAFGDGRVAFEERDPLALRFAKNEYLAIARSATEQVCAQCDDAWATAQINSPYAQFLFPRIGSIERRRFCAGNNLLSLLHR